MKAFRTFVAVLIDYDLRQRIAEVQERIKKLAPDVKWVAPENLHVTLKFLGDVSEDALPEIFAAVQRASGANPEFGLSFSGLGAFPNPQKARVLWVGIVNGREELVALAAAVESELVKAGFPREEKPFKAHSTIGRARMGRAPKGLAESMAQVEASDLGHQPVVSVAVMQSDLRPGGPVYTIMKSVPLQCAAELD